MQLFFHLSALLLAASTVSAQECPTGAQNPLEVAGSSTVEPVARAWEMLYETRCNNVQMNVRGGGSSAGARQVCAQGLRSPPDVQTMEFAVDIGNMSREWNSNEATPTSDFSWRYDCGSSTRFAIQVLVAFDGISVVTAANSAAQGCLNAAFGDSGLTLNQLRWIFSNYDDTQLLATGWTNDLLGTSNNDATMRTWAELGGAIPECPAEQIAIAGADADSGTQEFFLEAVLTDFENGEFFSERGTGYFNSAMDELIVDNLQSTTTSIGYIPYAFVIANPGSVDPVAIQNPATNEFVAPSALTISSGDYSPFSRPIYMNVLDVEATLRVARPLFAVGFSFDGEQAVIDVGYVPVDNGERLTGLSRLEAEGGVTQTAVGTCGPQQDFTIAGSSTVFPVAELWTAVWTTWCPGINVVPMGGGSSRGACRVCNQCDTSHGDPIPGAVDIGNMSRDWRNSEATTPNGYEFDCVGSSRRAIQVEVAIDGLSVVTSLTGIAHDCFFDALGGLSRDQLRWIYSDASRAELVSDGWDPTSVPFEDGNDSTHTFDELSDMTTLCPRSEILLSGADILSGTYDFMQEFLFGLDGESFDLNRPGATEANPSYFNSELDEEVVEYLVANERAVGYFGFAYVIQNTDRLDPVPIFNDVLNQPVAPSAVSVEDGDYPIARRIFMNVLDDTNALRATLPFMEFGLSDAGQELVLATGYSALPPNENLIMHARIESTTGNNFGADYDGPCATNDFSIAGSSTVFPVAELWAGIYEVVCQVKVTVMGGGSSAGAARVCANTAASLGEPVEIGNMSREWRETEAVLTGDVERVYQCVAGDTSRQVIQAQVGTDGLTIATATNSAASACIALLGGLTIQQLRWIYSSLSDADLEAQPDWDSSAVPNLDANPNERRWNELNAGCADAIILISGADSISGTFDFFSEVVFTAEDETFDFDRTGSNYVNDAVDEVLLNYIQANSAAITYFGYTYFFSNQDVIDAAPIINPNTQAAVSPNPTTIENGSYFPFSRPIYMNLLNADGVIDDLETFLRFGYSEDGNSLTEFVGYVPLTSAQSDDVLSRIAASSGGGGGGGGGGGTPPSDDDDDDDDGLSAGAIVGIIIAVIVGVAILAFVAFKLCGGSGDKQSDTGAKDFGAGGDAAGETA